MVAFAICALAGSFVFCKAFQAMDAEHGSKWAAADVTRFCMLASAAGAVAETLPLRFHENTDNLLIPASSLLVTNLVHL
jgi:hypothetical protein